MAMANVIALCEFHLMSLSLRLPCGKVSFICLCSVGLRRSHFYSKSCVSHARIN